MECKKVKLKTLIKDLPIAIRGSKDLEVTGISADSRRVVPGNLFLAKKGAVYNGAEFIPQALQAGASAVVTDIYDPFIQATQLIHPSPQTIEALLAARYYDFPSQELFTVGITGTKGKTTTTHLIHHVLEGLGQPCGLIGTVETIIGTRRFFSTLTTHDVIANQKFLREIVSAKGKAAALEVSSHALEQTRVDEISFDLALFTNLYPDHLDYHQTIDAYAQAKRKLFQKAKRSILNADSPYASVMGEGFTFAIEKTADLQAENISLTPEGAEFTVLYQGKKCRFKTNLIGRFNVYNALGAIAVGLDQKGDLEKIRDLLSQFSSVPGRLEKVAPGVFVDFAHNGESLMSVLQSLREFSPRIIVVFGCGGNRDPGRRIAMAQAAEKYADLSIITVDNPRFEDPQEIVRQILTGFTTPPLVEMDRRKAIHLAIEMAKPGDIVLIAGKGHERGQVFAHHTVPFDDVAVARQALLKT